MVCNRAAHYHLNQSLPQNSFFCVAFDDTSWPDVLDTTEEDTPRWSLTTFVDEEFVGESVAFPPAIEVCACNSFVHVGFISADSLLSFVSAGTTDLIEATDALGRLFVRCHWDGKFSPCHRACRLSMGVALPENVNFHFEKLVDVFLSVLEGTGLAN